MVLENYSEWFSFIGTSATIPLILSPILICRSFMQKGSSDHIKPLVFISLIVRSALMVQTGIEMRLNQLAATHAIGMVLNIIYLTLYYQYSKSLKGHILKLTAVTVVFLSVIIGPVNFQPDSFIKHNFHTIVTIINMGLLSTPLLNIKNIMRTKSTEGLPFPILLCANIVMTSWFLFALSQKNGVLMFQMSIGMIITGVQLSLFVIYPSRSSSMKKKSS